MASETNTQQNRRIRAEERARAASLRKQAKAEEQAARKQAKADAKTERATRSDERKRTKLAAAESAFRRKIGSIYGGQVQRAAKHKLAVAYSVEEFRGLARAAFAVGTCPYSGDKLRLANLAADHILPASRGGGFTLENIAFATEAGNGRKGTMTAAEFRELRTVVDSFPDVVRKEIWAKLRQPVRMGR